MISSSILNAAISGVNANAQRLGAAADNIANASTNGYKRTAVQTRTVSTGQGGGAYASGGVQTVSHQLSDVQGLLAPSASNTDLAISGDGFFAVARTAEGGETLFTRDGSFRADNQGFLVNGAGYYLLATTSGGNDLQSVQTPAGETAALNVAQDGQITAQTANGDVQAVGDIQIAAFSNPAGLEALTGGAFRATEASGDAVFREAGQGQAASVQSGALELSNTDIGTEFANTIVAEHAYAASLAVLKTADQMGQSLLDETA